MAVFENRLKWDFISSHSEYHHYSHHIYSLATITKSVILELTKNLKKGISGARRCLYSHLFID